ncbi:MAG: phosphatase family protein [Solirubrobacterales bacterium]|nr:phosphatase family protein [Solirubrobacterales bacterium]
MTDWVSEREASLLRLAAGSLIVAIVVFGWEHLVGPLPGERWLTDRAYHRIDANAQLARGSGFLSSIGFVSVAVPTIAVVAWFVHREFGPRWAVLVPLAAVPGVVARVVKGWTGPTELAREVNVLPGVTTGALPSGHAAYAAALFGLVLVLGVVRRRTDVAVVAGLLIAAIAAALVLQGAHHPADVLDGVALGTAWLLAVIVLAARFGARVGLDERA